MNDVGNWDNELYLAVMYALASQLVLPLGGKTKLRDDLTGYARDIALLAATNVANEESSRMEEIPEVFAVRGYADMQTTGRYYYPYQTINGVPA